MDNKKPRSVKHQHDRLVDKRRRRIGKEICQKGNFMSERRELLSICYHADDDTGIHHIGEIGFGINGIEKYGYEDVKEILAMLGHLKEINKN